MSVKAYAYVVSCVNTPGLDAPLPHIAIAFVCFSHQPPALLKWCVMKPSTVSCSGPSHQPNGMVYQTARLDIAVNPALRPNGLSRVFDTRIAAQGLM